MQGAGRVGLSMLATVLRATIAAGGGWLAVTLLGSSSGLFAALAVALVVYGLSNAAIVASGAWFSTPKSSALPAPQAS